MCHVLTPTYQSETSLFFLCKNQLNDLNQLQQCFDCKKKLILGYANRLNKFEVFLSVPKWCQRILLGEKQLRERN